jgi:hypothetical protein
MSAERHRRRRLRLGALLYRLQYYAVPDHRDAQGQITLYRRDAGHWVEVTASGVRLVGDGVVETLDLEAAIVRCQEALAGQPVHRPGADPG